MAEYYTMTDEREQEIVALLPDLDASRVREIALADWPQGDEHQRWLETAPAAEVADWVAGIAAAEDEEA